MKMLCIPCLGTGFNYGYGSGFACGICKGSGIMRLKFLNALGWLIDTTIGCYLLVFYVSLEELPMHWISVIVSVLVTLVIAPIMVLDCIAALIIKKVKG